MLLWKRVLVVFVIIVSFSSETFAAVAMKAGDKGIEIDAGTIGTITVEYPVLLGADQKPAAQLVQSDVADSTVTLRYGGDVTVVGTIDADGFSYRVSNAAAVKFIRTQAILSSVGLTDGTWKFDDKPAEPFPAEKPAKPHLFQGQAAKLTITGADDTKLVLGSPRAYSFNQLTDNREWGWNVFAWRVDTAFDSANPVFAYTVGDGSVAGASAEPKKPSAYIDPFGQSIKSDFPDKVRSDEELKADVESEKAYYASLTSPALDRFGGLDGSGETLALKATGFFHVVARDGRWMMVNPLGNLFYPVGVCVHMPGDDYTYVAGREGAYAWLPEREGEFGSTYRSGEPAMSFHLTNQIRKYGKPYDHAEYQSRMIDRLRAWGFNCAGPFASLSKAVQEANFPYVVSLHYGAWPGIPDLPGAARTWDPFEPANRERVEREFARSLPLRVDDPLLIGYYLNNEPLFEDLPRVVARLNGSKHAAKRELVAMLAKKYGTIDAFNAAWGMSAGAFTELVDPGIPVATATAAADMQDFADIFFESYYKLIYDTFKKHDKNHLLLGNRFQSGTINNERLVRIMAKYNDVVSFNYYTYAIDTSFLKRIYAWSGKPMMMTEWFYASPRDSGLGGGGKEVSSQVERGLAYRNYVEQTAALPFMVGSTWFTLVDQSVTGRWFSKYNGENGNSGLIAVTDRPWKQMLAHAMETNYSIYDVVLGKREPFAWDDPRFVIAAAADKRISIARATGTVAMDGTAAGFPGTPAETVSGSRLVVGLPADEFEASFKLCYDDQNLYLLAEVIDATPLQNVNAMNYLWSGDGIELFIGHERLDVGGQLLFSDRQVIVAASPEPKAVIARHQSQPMIRSTAQRRGDGRGYVLQAAIPFESLGFTPKEGDMIRFDIGVNDSADGKDRQRQLMWNGTARNSGDRTGWGRASFAK
ncbi:MAG TPA: sugar-binding protein [Tepidisphaeraceae bacterium]|jgi:hypothetical protein|nr:sugar-binding protein [Tepidisphaeraceae bacterium]